MRHLFKGQPVSLLILGAIILFVLFIGIGSALIVMAKTIHGGLLDLPFCMLNQCVDRFLEANDQVFIIAKATLDIGVAIATIGGIFVALLSYFNTASNNALTNHIEHLKVFGEYLSSEIAKRDRLSPALIDTLCFYGIIFKQSYMGKTTVSDEYRFFLDDLNKIIKESNSKCVSGVPGGFSYMEHQRKVSDHMKRIGIIVYLAPRNDYFEMEKQLFSLLHRITQSFCSHHELPAITECEYH